MRVCRHAIVEARGLPRLSIGLSLPVRDLS
jgi:hypothetical protein